MPASHLTLYIIGGCNGAGKTTFAKEFLPSIAVIRFLEGYLKRFRDRFCCQFLEARIVPERIEHRIEPE